MYENLLQRALWYGVVLNLKPSILFQVLHELEEIYDI